MLSHLGYICSIGERDNNVRFYKNMKLDMVCVLCGWGDMAPVPLELAESQHL
jgi:hypothetical protein